MLDVGRKEEEGRQSASDTVIPGSREYNAVINRNNREGVASVTEMMTERLSGWSVCCRVNF